MIHNRNLHGISGACHEAGHAIVARHLGLVIREASYALGENGQHTGYVDYLPCGIFEAYPLVAGYVAQLKAAGRKESMHFAVGSFSDYQRLQELLHPYLGRDQLSAYEYKLEDDVAGFLNQPEVWNCVVDFAEALSRSGHLSSLECMRLTDEVPQAKLVEAQQTLLSAVLHNHFGRRIGQAKRVQQEKLLSEAVERLRPAFQIRPPFDEIRRTLQYEGYSKDQTGQVMLNVYSFWLQPT